MAVTLARPARRARVASVALVALFAPALTACGDSEPVTGEAAPAASAPSTTAAYDWDAAIAAATAKLQLLFRESGEGSDIEPADPNDVACPLAEFGTSWLAEPSGSVICATETETTFEGLIATVDQFPFDELAGDGMTLDAPTSLGPGSTVAGCGSDACTAVWDAGTMRVVAVVSPDRGADAARAIVDANVTTVLDNLAVFDLARLATD